MLLLSGSSTQKCKCDWRFLLILKWREIFMCQITLKCLASQGTACCRNSNRSYRSLHWKYQSWMQWRGRVCCRSLHKELRRYKAREGWAFHCDFLIGFYYHCGCIKCLPCWTGKAVEMNGRGTKRTWYFQATLHHPGKCKKIYWGKVGGVRASIINAHSSFLVGKAAVSLTGLFPSPASSWLTL